MDINDRWGKGYGKWSFSSVCFRWIFKVRLKVFLKWNANWSREGRQNYTKGGLWQAEQTPQVGGALALRSASGSTKETGWLVQTSLSMERGEENEAELPDWRVAGLISDHRGLSLVTTKVSSSPHLSTHQNLKSFYVESKLGSITCSIQMVSTTQSSLQAVSLKSSPQRGEDGWSLTTWLQLTDALPVTSTTMTTANTFLHHTFLISHKIFP